MIRDINMTQKLGPKQQEWVDVLRSGKYKQGKGRLHVKNFDGTDSYCCLGVLCELNKDDLKVDVSYSGNRSYDGKYNFLPIQLVIQYHMNNDGCSSTKTWANDISHLNDNGRSFGEIADIIEANPSEYFNQEY